MVVLEGTTSIKGEGSGIVTDPGAFSGGAREFFLSDRWFSWDNPIELNLDLTATTGLVGEVKRLMLANAAFVSAPPPPNPPTKPKALGFFQKIYPVRPKKPEMPDIKVPDEPPPPARRSLKDRLKGLFIMTIVGAVLVAIIAFWFDMALFGTLVTATSIFSFLFFAEIASPKLDYEDKLKKRQKQIERSEQAKIRYQKAREDYQAERENYRVQCQKAREQAQSQEEAMMRYRNDLERYETITLRAYEAEKNRILTMREMLWARARVCMRCGSGYIGE